MQGKTTCEAHRTDAGCRTFIDAPAGCLLEPAPRRTGVAQPSPRPLVVLAAVQGAFYVATGVWGLVDLDSFQRVTGPKTDLWLVRTVAVLVTVVGGVLLVAASRHRVAFETALLAAGCALGLATVDVVYASSDVIRDVYLLDAAVEVGLAALWGLALWRARDDVTLWGGELHGAARQRLSTRRGLPPRDSP